MIARVLSSLFALALLLAALAFVVLFAIDVAT